MSDVIISISQLKKLIRDKLCQFNMKHEDADVVSDVLSYADAIGVRSMVVLECNIIVKELKLAVLI